MRISLALLIFAFHSRIHVLQCDYGLLNGFIDMGAIAMTGFFLLSGYALHLSYGKKDMSDIPSIRKFYSHSPLVLYMGNHQGYLAYF